MAASIGTPLLWAGFTLLLVTLLALDLGVFHRKAREVHPREALLWTMVWVSLALAFNAGIYLQFGRPASLEFLTGYVIEYALSMDNLFVFLLLFRYFSVPADSHHRTLFWGIFGALVLRGVFIVLGAFLLAAFHWVMFVFGAFLVVTGIKVLVAGDVEVQPERNPVVRLFQKWVPTLPHYAGSRMVVRQGARMYATPLLVVLVALVVTDVVFATDSIPAIFAVTQDPFLVFTSNMFALLGLRSLYFVLAGAMNRFQYLNAGLGLVLAFVGMKMLVSDYYKIPILLSLGVVAILLAGSIVSSLLRKPAEAMIPVPQTEEAESLERRY